MKKLLLLLVIILGLTSVGCKKFWSESSYPPTFVIIKTSQNQQEKQFHVARYKVTIFTYGSDGGVIIGKNDWFTLQEGFQVGDTLRLTK